MKKGGSRFDFVSMVSNLRFLAKVIPPKLFEHVLHFHQEIQGRYAHLVMDPLMKKLREFEETLPNKGQLPATKEAFKPLSASQVKKLAQFIFSKMEDLGDLQILDIEHSEFRKRLTKLYSLLLKQDLTNWNKILYEDIDILGTAKYHRYLDMLRSTKIQKKLKALRYLTDWVGNFVDKMSSFYATMRSGFPFPGFTLEMFCKIWFPEIRKLYLPIYEAANQLGETHSIAGDAYISLCYAVTHMLYSVCDFNVFTLKRELYAPEYDFLTNATFMSARLHNTDINGEIVDCLLLMDGDRDPAIARHIRESQTFLIQTQTPSGAWYMDDKISVHAVHTAIIGLLEHNYTHYASHLPYELPSFDVYVSTLNQYGLFKYVPPRYTFDKQDEDNVKHAVWLSLKKHKLDQLLQAEMRAMGPAMSPSGRDEL
jgi:hypothetical protein